MIQGERMTMKMGLEDVVSMEIPPSEIAMLLYGAEAIEFGPRKLKYHEKHPDAPLSWIYLNLRGEPDGRLKPEILKVLGYFLGWHLRNRLESFRFDYIVGLPKAGEPIAEAFAQVWKNSAFNKTRLIHLAKEEVNGKRRIVAQDNTLPPGEVLVIDDVITTADTKLEAIEVLRGQGHTVKHCAVVLDRQQHGRQQLAKVGVQLWAGLMLDKLLEYYQSTGLITHDSLVRISENLQAMEAYMVAHPE